MTTEEWHRVLAVNLDGAFFTLRAAARHMTERGAGGSLAVTASLAALEGSPLSAHYAASKGAMLSVMRALSVGLARHKIRVNAIVPGWIETPMTEKAVHGEAFQTRAPAGAGAALGHRQRFRRHRGLPGERREQLPHRRHLRHRRRLRASSEGSRPYSPLPSGERVG